MIPEWTFSQYKIWEEEGRESPSSFQTTKLHSGTSVAPTVA